MFEEVLPHTLELCCDVFGNYCLQKLLAVGTPEQQLSLIDTAVEGNVLELSLHMYGCRTVQAMVTHVFCTPNGQLNTQVLSVERQDKMLMELDEEVMRCAQDQNANHVLQVLLEKVRPISRIGFLLKAFKGNMKTLAMHFCGCRVVQHPPTTVDRW